MPPENSAKTALETVCPPPMAQAVKWLRLQQASSGFYLDPVHDPLAILRDPHPDRSALYKLGGGCDVWHTTMIVRALKSLGLTDPKAEAALRAAAWTPGSWPHWRAQVALCVETSCAIAEIFPDCRPDIIQMLEKHALPDGSWATVLTGEAGGWTHYVSGPSVSAWALSVLAASHPLAQAATAALHRNRQQGLWRGHDGFYGSGLYVAALSAPYVGDDALVGAICQLQQGDGGWGFDSAPQSSATLPTAWAILALRACQHQRLRSAGISDAITRGCDYLWAQQVPDGHFPGLPRPEAIFYTGDLFATTQALIALQGSL